MIDVDSRHHREVPIATCPVTTMSSSLTPVIVVLKRTASADEVEAYASLVTRNGMSCLHI